MFPLVPALGSTRSATACAALFPGFTATMAESDFSSLTTHAGMGGWPALGRRGAVANDERAGEVRLGQSSCEAWEQSRASGGGSGGAKGREAQASARHKQSSGLLMSGLSLDRTPFEPAAQSRPKNAQALSPERV